MIEAGPDTWHELASDLSFPEGPAFESDGRLWWVEYDAGYLSHLIDGEVDRRQIGGSPNGLAFDHLDRPWVCDAYRNELRQAPQDGRWEVRADSVDGQPLRSPNDLAFDKFGNLLFTCPGGSHGSANGTLCCLDRSGRCQLVETGLSFPNGIAFVGDGDRLVVGETDANRLIRGRWIHERRELVDLRPWSEIPGGVGPDGIAVAEDGTIFVAVYGAGTVRQLDSNGDTIADIHVPGKYPTNVALDPSESMGLVVTEAEHGRIFADRTFDLSPALHGGRSPM